MKQIKKKKKYYFARYLIILLLFAVSFIFGKNIPTEFKDQGDVQQAQKLENLIQGVYEISAKDSSIEIDKLINATSGESYRLLLDVDVRNDLTQISKTEELQLNLLSDTGDATEEETFKLSENQISHGLESLFVCKHPVKVLQFVKKDVTKSSVITLSNITLSRLNVESTKELTNLKPTIYGGTVTDRITIENNQPSSKGFTFNRKNQLIGQVFTAPEELLSGIDLNLEIIGSGGLGNYFLEVRQIEEKDGKPIIGLDRMAYYYFDTTKLLDLKYAKNSYHFPIAAKLTTGKKYFIGLNNEQVHFGIYDNIRLHYADGNTNGYGIKINGKRSASLNSFFFRLYGVDQVKLNSQPLLTSSSIEDLGAGIGHYHYRASRKNTDFIDVDWSSSLVGNPTVYYDNVTAGISAEVENGNQFGYHFIFNHRLDKLKFKLSRTGGDGYLPIVAYSLDQKNWDEVHFAKDALTGEYQSGIEQNVSGNGLTTEFYLKISYEKTSELSSSNLFGIKDLELNADLLW